MTGAFMTLTNRSGRPATLRSASSSKAGMVQLHEMVMVDGKMTMREAANGIEIPAQGEVTLAPGGLHVMLMGLKGALEVGDEVDLALTFADGARVDLVVPVKKFVEEEDHYHSPSPTARTTA